MKKFKIISDFVEEEKYLNDMAKEGYIFKKYSILEVYHFVKGEKQDLKYKVDYRTFKNKKSFEEYKTMFEDFGWKHIYGTRDSGKQFFLPIDKDSNDEIFSNKESYAARYKRLYKMCLITILSAILYLIVSYNIFGITPENFGFLTPGIWEKTGDALKNAVLFELPFVCMRAIPLLAALVIATINIGIAFKVKKLYNKSILEEK